MHQFYKPSKKIPSREILPLNVKRIRCSRLIVPVEKAYDHVSGGRRGGGGWGGGRDKNKSISSAPATRLKA
jgi:hypothetical protein